ncbi:MAG: serine hydrolase [Deltaproteobacteria bacterium HGW-Deltaproteobacteria-21]|nr:MAG: serine hydrolase [Deltaproteobacteria bacterium HGW-Deltaproteobacteria-21]
MKLLWCCLALCGRTLIVLVALHSTSFAEPSLERLRSRVESAIPPSQGVVGVSIKHMESGIVLAVHGDEPFPMASTFKLPLLVELYAKEKEGAFKWDDLVEISSTDQHLGSSGLTALYDTPGVVLSIRNLANLMIIASDNSAADICLSKVGGPSKVTAGMRKLGIEGIRIDRSCQELILDYGGRDTARLKHLARDDLQEFLRNNPRPETEDARFAEDDRLAADPADSATPDAMVALLERIWQGRAVDPAASDAMMKTLNRCRTGANRIRGLLPPSTDVAHKTGTLGGVVNDVGIIALPDNAGHVAIAVMCKRTRAPRDQVERVIADIARYAYDYFTFTAKRETR